MTLGMAGMKESDYIAATNLARVYVALQIIGDITPHGPITDDDRKTVAVILSKWADALNKKIG